MKTMLKRSLCFCICVILVLSSLLTPVRAEAAKKCSVTYIDNFYTNGVSDGTGNGATYYYDYGYNFSFSTSPSSNYSYNGQSGYHCTSVRASGGISFCFCEE